MKILNTLLLLCFLSGTAFAQVPAENVYMVDMSSALPYVLLFYFLTFISLGLLLLKLVRPSFPMIWLYITCIIGIVGAAVVNFSFNDIQNEQLPRLEQNKELEDRMSPDLKEKMQLQQREVENQFYANYWIISIPNFVILGLGFFLDRNYRRRDPNKPRGRYD